ncbi:hypothetical protein VL2_gp128 [Pseudomonas phage vB_PaeM_VL12]|uniref:Uncharacterized protein n=3 Tax=Nankokuvirus TaxID=1925779 RepID=A0A218L3Y1_9CAUD|nr:hypothetical protein [Pseudomonas aeruginosa]YP_008858053.1 Rz-like spanin [Pseudomonas phage CHA_P1]YP_009206042.1 Rz-like spanin [Pseudomonas phage vB_PaeM_PS24]YP_009604707.1 Rz-like spanin [Pseudomonas phage vB_PaeM_G1]QIQ65175.1 hypothetical protein 18_00080 [Pseudomonas phage Epa18]UKM53941.1 hypothetical protein VL2_gp128 [Pseudomonas phage vB_PaeM_VL12]UVD32696.1 hypothetical protein [Pseudomonas phage PH826]AGR88984.1 hypothetical protein CHA_P10030 [Pseudomonas phage CHA_P1]AIW
MKLMTAMRIALVVLVLGLSWLLRESHQKIDRLEQSLASLEASYAEASASYRSFRKQCLSVFSMNEELVIQNKTLEASVGSVVQRLDRTPTLTLPEVKDAPTSVPGHVAAERLSPGTMELLNEAFCAAAPAGHPACAPK